MQPDCTTPPLKTCTKCGVAKTRGEFSLYSCARDGLQSQCKTCAAAYRVEHRDERAAYKATWRAEHSEETAAYRAEHREEMTAYHAAYHVAHRAERVAYSAAYHVAHRDEILAHQTAYRIEHRDEMAAWRAENPDKRAAADNNRRARKLGNGGTHTAADIRAQYARQNGRCYWQATDECRDRRGKLDKYHVDHVMPVILGGSNGPENLVISCPTCNLSKGGMHPMDFCGRLL